uniref:Uncharacterized protein n=1 Tax=Cacopsylla melanoneura TaxID=428564 RepID=A0A8D8VPQ9_9HEMI
MSSFGLGLSLGSENSSRVSSLGSASESLSRAVHKAMPSRSMTSVIFVYISYISPEQHQLYYFNFLVLVSTLETLLLIQTKVFHSLPSSRIMEVLFQVISNHIVLYWYT